MDPLELGREGGEPPASAPKAGGCRTALLPVLCFPSEVLPVHGADTTVARRRSGQRNVGLVPKLCQMFEKSPLFVHRPARPTPGCTRALGGRRRSRGPACGGARRPRRSLCGTAGRSNSRSSPRGARPARRCRPPTPGVRRRRPVRRWTQCQENASGSSRVGVLVGDL
jgi:hypothetical protein